MKDCAFIDGQNCRALKEKQCIGCRFCKTTEALNEGRKKAEERIRALPKHVQKEINRKYYSSRRTTDDENGELLL